ncbi:MAG: yjcF [Chlorobi bacterium]|nr:yjcF [Chlorobiota bacterium]
MTSFDIRLIAHRSPAYEETVALRDDILRKPLGLSFTPEQLGAEGGDYHLACYLDGALAGCLILTPVDDVALKMRQVAVAEEMQGRGVGRALVERSEEMAREKGFREIVLNARETAVPFYDRLRYERVGDRFEEVGIPHWKMRKSI